ncbi:MAG: FAD-dependent oxidoreductase [Nitriliruptorales bacterium]|nr:FAD-dependent oxidoreductase [Nitriliruptorales bacterium]
MGAAAEPSPRTVVVVGAGIVGLSCAWHLQSYGIQVTVLDRTGVAAGASHGNAGYVSPGLVAPLADPALVRYGARALLRRGSPVRIPLAPPPDTIRFLTQFARNATQRRWRDGMAALLPLGNHAQEAFDELVGGGVTATLHSAPILAVFEKAGLASGLLHEVAAVVGCGQTLDIETLSGDEARAAEPLLSDRIELGIRLLGQRFLDPAAFVQSLGAAVEQRGGRLRGGVTVRSARGGADGRVTLVADTDSVTAEAVVLASGAWLPHLAREHGVRTPMQAGRGYSFVVDTDPPPRGPIYFPAARSAGTRLPTGLRMTGLMDLDRADDPLEPSRIEVIRSGIASGLRGVDWNTRRDEWVGSRPLTADGLPLIGPTRTPGVYVAGGHGMWGLTLGPITGRLLARLIATGAAPDELGPFDPTR